MTVERCDDGPLTVVEKEEGPAIADYDDRFGRLALTIGQTHFRTTVVVRCDGDEGHDGVDDGDDDDGDDDDGDDDDDDDIVYCRWKCKLPTKFVRTCTS